MTAPKNMSPQFCNTSLQYHKIVLSKKPHNKTFLLRGLEFFIEFYSYSSLKCFMPSSISSLE